MNRYVIARVAPWGASEATPAHPPPLALVDLFIVNRRTFFQTCLHMARNTPRRAAR